MYKREYHNVVQGSDEWHALRAGRVGGSEADALLVTGKGSVLGTGAKTMAYKKMAQIHFPDDFEPPYQSAAMQRGNELEMEARIAYESKTGAFVQEVGYISYGEYFGFSPDGIIEDGGLIEIKCPLGPEIIRFLATGEIDKSHIAQMQWGMMITGAPYCDYVVYHPAYEVIINRVEPDEVAFEKFRENMAAYETLCKGIQSFLDVWGNYTEL